MGKSFKVTDLEIKNNTFYNLQDDNENITEEKLENIKEVITATRIQIVSGDMLFLGFIISVVIPFLFPIWIIRWINMWRRKDEKYLILVFKNQFGDMGERTYIFDRDDKNIVDNKMKEINELVNNSSNDKIHVIFKKYKVFKVGHEESILE